MNANNDTMAESPTKTGNGAGIGGNIPPVEHRFKPGNPGGPGRPTAGFSIREQINLFVFNGTPETDLRRIARDAKEKPAQRIAAARLLRAMESGDLADFLEVVAGTKTLKQLRDEGVNTEVVKKLKHTKDGPEIELYDRAGEAMDALIGHTELSISEIEKNARIDDGKATDLVGLEPVILRQPVKNLER